VDLVQAQLLLAAGQSLEHALGGEIGVHLPGALHAIEARITAEDPAAGWLPSTGVLERVREPAGPGVRVDSACEPGLAVTVHYDSLLAKLIVTGRSRQEAIARLRRALDEYVITGVRTSLPFHRWLVRDEAFLAGELSTGFVAERWPAGSAGTAGADGEAGLPSDGRFLAAAVAVTHEASRGGRAAPARLHGSATAEPAHGAPTRAERTDGRAWTQAARREALR
jgi:acetyl/propionyl-CoA carboxylase alpha subunit